MAVTRTLDLALEGTITEGTATRICDRNFTLEDAAILSYVDDVVVVGASVTDQVLSLASLGGTAKYLMLEFDGALTVKINSSSNTGIAFAANGFLAIAAGTVTNLYLTNAGTSTVTVKRLAAFS